jgi:hypothetical protein
MSQGYSAPTTSQGYLAKPSSAADPTAVTAAAVIADNAIVRGDGGARGIQASGWTIDDNDDMHAGARADRIYLSPDSGESIRSNADKYLEFRCNDSVQMQVIGGDGVVVNAACIRGYSNNTKNLGTTTRTWKHGYIGTSLYVGETAAAAADVAAFGQHWVKNTTPCEAWFTDDAGTDAGLVTSTAAIADNALLRGDGGAQRAQACGWTVDDNDDLAVGARGDVIDLSGDGGETVYSSADNRLVLGTGGQVMVGAYGGGSSPELSWLVDPNTGFTRPASDDIGVVCGGLTVAKFDTNATAGNTRLFIWDVDNAQLERVSVGAADSGGAGYKVLRIPN